MLQTVALKLDVVMLHCSFCTQPLKPSVFKCKGCHLACGRCVRELPGNRCQKCEHPGGGFDHESAMDVVVSMAMVECPHSGCGSLVVNHELHNHVMACPHAPCSGTEPGSDFAAPPGALVLHLAAAHSIKVHSVRYCMDRAYQESVPVPGSPSRRLIIKGEDGAVFVLTIEALGPATVLSCACVRSAASVWPLYRVKMWANGPGASSLADCRSRTDTVVVEFEASSSASPGDVAFEKLTSFVGVTPRYLVGAGTSKQLRFYIHVEELSSSKI